MKKSLSIAVFALASLWLTPGTSSAGGTFGVFTQTSCWPFSCFACCDCCGCCGKFNSTICVKPYNAFSPTCSGTLYCDGFCPLGTRPGYGPPQSALPPLDFGSLPTPAPCCEGGPVGGLTPPLIPGGIDAQPTANPMPGAPVQWPGPNTSRVWQNPVPSYGPIQASYSYPTYTPNYNYAQPMAVPYYWNNNGR
jgi:hypothetical protein